MKYTGKCKKALTFSFDDGNMDDIRLVEILNKYGLKCTFNLNSGSLSRLNCWRFNDCKDVYHLNFTEHPHVYDGHEIACHTLQHPDLTKLDRETVRNQVRLDRIFLSALAGYEVRGMAYPYGTCNDQVAGVLQEEKIAYCRTTHATYDFRLPEKPLMLDPTCHFKDARMDELADRFMTSQSDGVELFYIWGHSYELVTEEQWQKFDDFCKRISGHEDIWYCTNIKFIDALY